MNANDSSGMEDFRHSWHAMGSMEQTTESEEEPRRATMHSQHSQRPSAHHEPVSATRPPRTTSLSQVTGATYCKTCTSTMNVVKTTYQTGHMLVFAAEADLHHDVFPASAAVNKCPACQFESSS